MTGVNPTQPSNNRGLSLHGHVRAKPVPSKTKSKKKLIMLPVWVEHCRRPRVRAGLRAWVIRAHACESEGKIEGRERDLSCVAELPKRPLL
jgi:hypothetical protein